MMVRCKIFIRSYSMQVLENASIVSVPAYVKQHLVKAEKREALKKITLLKKVLYRGDTSFPVIKSTNKEFNFYLGQIYNENYPLPLQSKYWFKAKSAGQKFTICPWEMNPSLPIEFTQSEDSIAANFPSEFTQLGLHEQTTDCLRKANYNFPTPLQTLTIPRILEHNHTLCAAETGSGKTVAYLAPIIQQILHYKKTMKQFPETPLALVLTPSRELAEQIADVAYSLGNNCNIDVKLLVPDGTKRHNLVPYNDTNVDLLVASFGILDTLFRRRIFKIANLQHLVLDEADTLLDDTFINDIKCFIKWLPLQSEVPKLKDGIKPFGTQMIFVSSTYPDNVGSILPEDYTENMLTKIKSNYLHRVQPHVLQQFYRVNNDSRAGELLDLVKTDFQKKAPVMVFCNKSPTCDWISLFLEENGVPNVKFHGRMQLLERSKSFQEFKAGKTLVMCCTDLASRGLDTQWVKHVINFDFPTNVSDYILRAGRVGRVGTNHGYVTSFLVSRSGVYTLKEVEMAVRKMERLSNVDANIKKKIKKLFSTV